MMKTEQWAGKESRTAGFSLVELLVAMAVFFIISVASFNLFVRHEALLSQEKGVAGLNIGLRSALAQIQMDVVNAGNGLILGANVPAWPVGVTIVNSNPTAAQCNPSPGTYAAACFDQLNVVMVDPSTPPLHPQNSSGNCINTSSGSSLYGAVPAASPLTYSQVSPHFLVGDQVLFLTSTGEKFTTAVLTAAGANSSSPSGYVYLTFGSTLATGANSSTASPSNDPLGITTNSPTTELTTSFCSGDWVLRLLPINYQVSVTMPDDPQLVRTQSGTPNVVMDQVIGFKVGAAWWNNGTSFSVVTTSSTATPNVTWVSGSQFDTSGAWVGQNVLINNLLYQVTAEANATGLTVSPPPGAQSNVNFSTNGASTESFTYDYQASDYSYDFTVVRAVRVTIIGRTKPSTDPTYTYHNPFDNGKYQIRGSSIIVDPRNLTMGND